LANWEIGLIILGSGVAFVEILVTHKTPLYFIAVIFTYLEAGVRQAALSLWAMVMHYAKHYPERVQEVRAQLQKRQPLVVMAVQERDRREH